MTKNTQYSIHMAAANRYLVQVVNHQISARATTGTSRALASFKAEMAMDRVLAHRAAARHNRR
jgi:hypothetical protein